MRTLEQNLEILRAVNRQDIAALIEELPEHEQAGIAACVVRLEAPLRAAILDAPATELAAFLDRLVMQESTR